MYQKTLSFYIAMMYRNFSSFTSKKLQEAGLNFGLLFFIIYIGKHPGCSPSQLREVNWLIKDLSQRKKKEDITY